VSAFVTDILEELERLLATGRFQDYAPNGLQVPGPREVSSVATGVSAHAELFELAAAEQVELLVVHHGLFWGPGFQVIDDALKHRLKLLFDAGIGLAAYHLPLDAHPEIGNNALIADGLGADERERFAPHHGEPIGMLARFGGDGVAADELFARVSELTGREPLVFADGPRRVRRLAIVSGAGSDCPPPRRRAPMRFSPVSPPSARWRSRASHSCTSSPPGTTRPRLSA
jgi:putative NIF3 family GTP cyclohydrolase 1 type 2